MHHPAERIEHEYTVPPGRWTDPFVSAALRFAASGWIPARWFLSDILPRHERAAKTGVLDLEIVSHCWQYAHFLGYQLSSLVNYPPQRLRVTMTVYYSAEDERTASILAYFGNLVVPGVQWNWRSLPKEALFRRAIGRNEAALATRADWIWFTDCDLIFHQGCLDRLADELQGRQDALVYPREEYCTELLAETDRLLDIDVRKRAVVDIDPARFIRHKRNRATGPLQITHGDVARGSGYCNSLGFCLRPARMWRKAHEDRIFRWLTGTRGEPLDIPGVYRIRHKSKGRYTGSALNTGIRSWIRLIALRLKEL